MSRIGKKPVELPKGVSAEIAGQEIRVKGPKGQLSQKFPDEVKIEFKDNVLTFAPRDESARARGMWGLSRALASNMATGVATGFTRKLEITGVGYRAAVQGKNLQLQLGYSHDVVYPIPEGVSIACERPTEITITGADKQQVGQVAAEIRGWRPPEPYKGKGVRYADEFIFRKEGKKK